ncbi:hypothetical protein TPA2_gp72 [Tsukamurella phage TPA2]|uniref:hypothetical protein n=1 Tax=Tsukamurella phage TPA2 TaxID=981330 RepID=UPI0001FF8DDF|nr:hypothetical protein TPA2_gp72 [Tsukamurella phage TPA2]ADX31986.1 hypothetical protein [Tsukamurella phage TPA2]
MARGKGKRDEDEEPPEETRGPAEKLADQLEVSREYLESALEDDTNVEVWAKAYMLRVMHGASYRDIGAKLGITEQRARYGVVEMLKRASRHSAEELIGGQMVILSELKRAHLPYALLADKDASKMVMDILDHEARLHGLYSPSKVQLSTVSDADFVQAMHQLVRALGPGEISRKLQAIDPSAPPIAPPPAHDALPVVDVELDDDWAD